NPRSLYGPGFFWTRLLIAWDPSRLIDSARNPARYSNANKYPQLIENPCPHCENLPSKGCRTDQELRDCGLKIGLRAGPLVPTIGMSPAAIAQHRNAQRWNDGLLQRCVDSPETAWRERHLS